MYLSNEKGKLYYEVIGDGEPLLCIHGAIVDSQMYEELANVLSTKYRVILYDRRGNSRSTCRSRKFDMEDQIDDIKELIDFLEIDRINILGASAGAVVGIHFLEKYPENVKQLMIYEPALLGSKINQDKEFIDWYRKIKILVNDKKYIEALLAFSRHIGNKDPMSPPKEKDAMFREFANVEFAFCQELPRLVEYSPDIEFLKTKSEQIAIIAGELSGDTPYHRGAQILAEELGSPLFKVKGAHNYPYDRPEDCSKVIIEILEKRGDKEK